MITDHTITFHLQECTSVTSEIIDDPYEPSTSKQDLEADDPSWLPSEAKRRKMPEEFTVTFKQKEWMKPVFPASDRGGVSTNTLFHQLHDLLVGNGVDMKNVIMSPTLIGGLRGDAQLSVAADIKARLTSVNIY